jgi:predicted dehydrogenase
MSKNDQSGSDGSHVDVSRRDVSRRGFLMSSAAAAGAIAACGLASAQTPPSANAPATTQATTSAAAAPKPKKEKKPLVTTKTKYSAINVAVIGVDGRGRANLEALVSAGANIVALCDIDSNKLARPLSELPGTRGYADFRELIDKEQKNIDAVLVATPDHTHAPAAMMAIKHGKHTYCEKPLTYDIYEARMLTEAARKAGVKTQMGNQGMAVDSMRRQVEYIRSGLVGAIKEVHVYTNRPIWPQGGHTPKTVAEVPKNINFDLWLGPAPARPYHVNDKNESVYLPFKWRGWWDFGTGALGDMACHLMNTAYWALNLVNPTNIEAISSGRTDVQAPDWSVIQWHFPELNGRAPVKVFWYDGSMLPPSNVMKGKPFPGDHNGVVFVGEKGNIAAAYMGDPFFVDDQQQKDFKPPEKTIPRSIGHHEEWLEAILGGPDAYSNFDHAGPLTEMVLLGNLTVRTGRPIEWDVAKMKVTNDREAQKYVRREYRHGWTL